MRSTLLFTILAGLSAAGCGTKGKWVSTDLCIDVDPEATTCPATADVEPESLFSLEWCDIDIKSVDGSGSVQEDPFSGNPENPELLCCYPATARDADQGCIVGRPFFADGVAQMAAPRPGSGWTPPRDPTIPHNSAMAEAWLNAALGEHASIAAFARVTLEMMALGAPADLLTELQQAAADEVQHAQLCFERVQHFGGGALEPGRFPLSPDLRLNTDPVSIAVAAVREGCIGETVSAWLAERAAERATDLTSKRVLTQIAADESRHAALSWRMVAWLMQEYGDEVRDAVVSALAEPVAVAPMLPGDDALAAFGAIPIAEHAALVQAARTQVLEPAAAVLLAA
ncbi:MAG: ferritin-like domain-containing protein [Myxococcota bacterium]